MEWQLPVDDLRFALCCAWPISERRGRPRGRFALLLSLSVAGLYVVFLPLKRMFGDVGTIALHASGSLISTCLMQLTEVEYASLLQFFWTGVCFAVNTLAKLSAGLLQFFWTGVCFAVNTLAKLSAGLLQFFWTGVCFAINTLAKLSAGLLQIVTELLATSLSSWNLVVSHISVCLGVESRGLPCLEGSRAADCTCMQLSAMVQGRFSAPSTTSAALLVWYLVRYMAICIVQN